MTLQPAFRQNQGGRPALRGQWYHPADVFRREFDTLLSRFFGGDFLGPFGDDSEQARGWGFDIDDSGKELVVRAEVPGFDEKELDVRLENDVLTIQAEKDQKGDGHREYRGFFRQLALPSGVDAEKVQADYRNGVLELHIPRPEGTKARRIAIRGAQAGSNQLGSADRTSKGGMESNQSGGKATKEAGQR